MTAIVKKSNKINFGAMRHHNQRYYHRLNNIYIDTAAVSEYLDLATREKGNDLISRIPRNIQVPSHSGSASVIRSPAQIRKIFTDAANAGQWEKSLTFAISLTEDLVANYIRLILRSKPLLILVSLKGNDGSINVSLADVINNGSEKILEDRVQARVVGAVYASPAEYAKYIGTLLKFTVPEANINPYVEMKARRDLIIHAGGIVNDIYIQKIKAFNSDSKLEDKLSVNREYFEESMRAMKRFSGCIFEQLVKEYGSDTDVQHVIKNKGI